MKTVFNFGKIDFDGIGKVENLVTVEVEYKEEKNNKKVFSVCGNVFNRHNSDVICAGQCLDTIAEFINDDKFNEIYRLWKQYHLNDMNLGCEHQKKLGWDKIQNDIDVYHFELITDVYHERMFIKEKSLKALSNGETVKLSEDEKNILNLEPTLISYEKTLNDNNQFYKLTRVEKKHCNLVKPQDHPNGLSYKPCPVCGHEYATSWVYIPVPEQDEKIIIELITENNMKKTSSNK